QAIGALALAGPVVDLRDVLVLQFQGAEAALGNDRPLYLDRRAPLGGALWPLEGLPGVLRKRLGSPDQRAMGIHPKDELDTSCRPAIEVLRQRKIGVPPQSPPLETASGLRPGDAAVEPLGGTLVRGAMRSSGGHVG